MTVKYMAEKLNQLIKDVPMIEHMTLDDIQVPLREETEGVIVVHLLFHNGGDEYQATISWEGFGSAKGRKKRNEESIL